MAKTILIFAYFWLFMGWTLTWFLPWIVLVLMRRKRALVLYTRRMARFWGRHFLSLVGADVVLEGIENVPETDRICFIANHQSIFDILMILGYSGKAPGFIAKKELAAAPVLNVWMLAIRCVFIERRNSRKATLAIARGVESLKAGNPMVIFPEGTRSRDGVMRRLKPGSLKLATRAEAAIVPVTLAGTFRLYEEKGRFTPARVVMTVHPPIDTKGMSPEEKKALPERLEAVIGSALPPEFRIRPEGGAE